ncbi:PP2C family serine/threonine-protein phosphatase [Sorangium cellulosum]|uniref:PP2C family protein-serine/threonine phosphatase n=1 Tax=Sorangium cellulosum TaxID=56 RepID=UPI003D9A7FC1
MDALHILAHASKGGWAPDGDDRCLVDRDLGLLLVANGSGPKYGGYHAPFGLDPGLDAFRSTFASSSDSEPARLLGALAAADATMRRLGAEYERLFEVERSRSPDHPMEAALRAADTVRPKRWSHLRSHCHFAGGITACSIQASGALCFVQVGSGRAYVLRDGRLRSVVKDHTLLTRMEEGEVSMDGMDCRDNAIFYRHIVTQLLGTGDHLKPECAQEHLDPRDRVLVCTEGVWNHDRGEESVLQLLAATPADFRKLLDATARGCMLDATAIRFSLRDA